MKTDNLHPSGERAAVTTRGWAAASRAIGGVTATDGTTVVFGVKELQFDGAIITDLDEDAALVTITGGGTSSVNEFGAIGDGVADDTTAIQDTIDAVCTAGGGIVYFPAGTYLISATLTITCDGMTLVGDGPGASIIKAAAGMATDDMIEVNADDCAIRNLRLTSASIKSGGVGILLNTANRVLLDNLDIRNQYDSIKLLDSFVIRLSDLGLNNQSRHGIWIDGAGNDFYVSGVVADNTVPATGYGIYISGGGALFAQNSDFLHFGYGLVIQPTAGQGSEWNFLTTCAFDNNTNDGIVIGGGAGDVHGVVFTNCWSASNGLLGINIGGGAGALDGIEFNDGRVIANGRHGVQVSTPAERITLADNLIAANSASSSATYHGIAISAGVLHLVISGNQSFNGLDAGTTQGYGLSFASGATDYLVLDGNDFSGNATGTIENLAGVTGTHRWQGGSASDTGWSATTFWRGDGTWATPAAGGSVATDTIFDAKGDLPVGTGADTSAKLTVGADDTILMADAAQATGLKWVASASPSAVGTAAAIGTSDTFTRGDHVHAHEPAHVAHDTLWDAAGDLAVGSGADTAARLAKGAAGAALAMGNSVVIWNAGTSFPAAKATGDRYYRTDLGMEFFWDGARWRSLGYEQIELTADVALPMSASGALRSASPILPGASDIWLVSTQTWFYVGGGTALSGSHKWIGTLLKSPAGTTLDTVNINSGASDTHRQSSATVIDAVMGTTNFEFDITFIKTGTPGSLYAKTRIAFQYIAV